MKCKCGKQCFLADITFEFKTNYSSAVRDLTARDSARWRFRISGKKVFMCSSCEAIYEEPFMTEDSINT